MGISFIVIGRNEGKYLKYCFSSILDIIKNNNLKNFEILYVDSNSQDNSLEIAKEFNITKIIKLLEGYNAAIARNLGAYYSVQNILFFIDGDMEVQDRFFREVYNESVGLKYRFVSGDYLNIYYDSNDKVENSERYFNNNEIIIQQEVGGLFLISREDWYLVKGMREIFRRSQDIDFALRLAKRGIFLVRLPLIAAYHHTINHKSNQIKWKNILSGNELFGRSLLYRYNIFNLYIYKRIIKHDYSLVVLIFTLFVFLGLPNSILYLSIFLYAIIIFYRAFKNGSDIFDKLLNIGYYLIRDLTSLLGIFFFFPRKVKKTKYIYINENSNSV